MDDVTPRLSALLNELHAELERQPAMDASRRVQLSELKADIERVLASGQSPGGMDGQVASPAPVEREALRGRLQALVVGFEGAHPQLAGTIEQAMNALSNFGI